MAKIKVISERPLYDGMAITFNAPCECSAVDGLLVCYNDISYEFTFRDAHGNDLAGLGNLFAEGALVKVILNTETNRAFIQNADTNTYLEERFANTAPAGYGLGEQSAVSASWSGIYRNAFVRSNVDSADGEWWYGLNIKYDQNIATQMAFKRVADKGPLVMAMRHRPEYGNSNPWLPWEYVNPPMLEGVEYRTTERFNGKPVYKRLNSNGALEYCLDGESTWYPYINYIGAAPAGYGLGGVATVITDWNTATENGFYQATSGALNHPFDWQAAWGYTVAANPNDLIQVAFTYTANASSGLLDGFYQKVRYCKSTTGWSEWEWVNPPLKVGEEYRTTERFDGKPVYAKLLNFGSGATSQKAIDITTGHIDSLVRVEGYWYNDTIKGLFTDAYFVSSITADNYYDNARIIVEMTGNATNYTGCPVVYYTKG